MGDTSQQSCDNDLYNKPDHNNGVEDFQLPELKLSDYLDYASQQQSTGVIAPLEGNVIYGAFALAVEEASLGIVWGETGSILAFKSTPQIDANKDAARKSAAGPLFKGLSLAATVVGPGKFVKPAKNAYSVYFETTIVKTGAGTREAHKAAANRNLIESMADKNFAQLMQKLGVNPVGGKNTPTGFIWHHSAERPGVMQLVPDNQHTKGSDFWSILHPGGSGGFANWGRNW